MPWNTNENHGCRSFPIFPEIDCVLKAAVWEYYKSHSGAPPAGKYHQIAHRPGRILKCAAADTTSIIIL